MGLSNLVVVNPFFIQPSNLGRIAHHPFLQDKRDTVVAATGKQKVCVLLHFESHDFNGLVSIRSSS